MWIIVFGILFSSSSSFSFFFFLRTFYLLSCNCTPVNTNRTVILYLHAGNAKRQQWKRARYDFMMQYCVRCRERKNIEINIYWIVCVVPSANRYVVAGTKCGRVNVVWLVQEHRSEIYEYQEKLWSACFCNDQHETKLIIEFIIVFFPHPPFIYFMLRFFPSSLSAIDGSVPFSRFYSICKNKFHVFLPCRSRCYRIDRKKKYA